MINSVNENKYRKEIISALEMHLPRLRELPVTSRKRDIIRDIIVGTLEAFPEKTKLPPIRAMASALGVTVVSVQKAINELAAAGLLITRDRSAVFSAVKPRKSPDKKKVPSAFCPFAMKFTFRTDSSDDYQRKMWLKIRDRFNSEHPTINAEIDFASYRSRTCEGADIMECAGYGWQAQAGPIEPMPVRRFIPAKGNIARDRSAYGDMHIPLYYRTYYLFYNPALLNKNNIPLPDYTSFEEQLEYLIASAKKCEKAKLEGRPFAITHPVTLLGALLPEFLDYVKSDSPAPDKKKLLADGFDKILLYLSLCKFDYNEAHIGTDFEFSDFFSEACPFFIGNSSSYWEFKSRSVKPGWEVYPIFAVDDKFVKWPVVGIVSSETRVPVESAKFISFLTRQDVQSEFIAPTGMVPVDLDEDKLGCPFEDGVAQKFIDGFKASTPLFLKDENDYYLANSVLNSEFWTAHLSRRTSGEELLDQAMFLAKAINENCAASMH